MRHFLKAFVASSIPLLPSGFLQAQGIWDGGGSNAEWSTAENWDDNDSIPPAESDVTFQSQFASGATINTLGNRSVANLTFENGPAEAVVLAGDPGDTLSISSGVAFNNTTSGSSIRISVPTLDVGANATLWAGDGDKSFFVSSQLSGSGQITKTGSHYLRLQGDNSGFTGGFKVVAGNINAEAPSAAIDNVFGTGSITLASTGSPSAAISLNRSEAASWSNEIINNCSGTDGARLTFQGDAFSHGMVNLTGAVSSGPNIADNARMSIDAQAGYSAANYGEGRWNVSGDWSGYAPPTAPGSNPEIVVINGTLQIDAQQSIAAPNVRYVTGQLASKGFSGNINIEPGIAGASTKIILNGPFTMPNTVQFEAGPGLHGTGLAASTSKSLGSSNAAATTATISGDIAHYTDAAVNLFCLNSGATLNLTGTLFGNSLTRNLFVNDGYSYSTGVAGEGLSVIRKVPAGTVVFSGNSSYTSNTRVVGGTLLVNGTSSGGGPLTVATGARLGGNGLIAGPTLLEDGADLVLSITSTGITHDSLQFGDSLTFDGVSTVFIENGTGAAIGSYVLASTVNGITGTLPGLVLPAEMSGSLRYVGNNLELEVTAAGATPYDVWAASFNLMDEQAAPGFDADSDNLKNLIEYALGTSPIAFSSSPELGFGVGGLAEFSFTRPDDRSDISTVGEYSTDLESWSSNPDLVETLIENNGDGTEFITVRQAATAPASLQGFFRLAVASNAAGPQTEWLPPGNWQLDWADEFSGTGEISKWFPLLGYNAPAFETNDRKGIRWSGSTEESSRMYSTRDGNHWLNGEGQLVMRIVTDKTQQNEHGNVVESAYLLSGYPQEWDSSEPYGVKWGGKFVSAADGPLYISARVRSDQVVGHSTWFAFWLFTETRAYNGNPADGTEVDIVEIVKGAPNYMDKVFNVANHWQLGGGSESLQFWEGGTPPSTSFVDVTDSAYHTYGIEWTLDYMKCYVDGNLFYTFTENIPTDPVDMMMLLTLEFQPNAWDPNQGDGRTTGPFISDGPDLREMSRAFVDHVRIYKKQ